jgi:hypothetical protein
MSLEKKLRQAATKAAQEAAMRERGRCLWLLDDMIVQTEQGLAKKLLIERDRQIAQVKLDIAKSLAHRLKRQVIAGRAPPIEGKFVEDYIECENCFDQGTMYHEGQRLCQGCYDQKRME